MVEGSSTKEGRKAYSFSSKHKTNLTQHGIAYDSAEDQTKGEGDPSLDAVSSFCGGDLFHFDIWIEFCPFEAEIINFDLGKTRY